MGKKEDVENAIFQDTDAVLFAVGMTRQSPTDLCTVVTRNVIDAVRAKKIASSCRVVICGGGSNLRKDDGDVTMGAKFVRWYADKFMHSKHWDKERQLALLDETKDVDWIIVRPLRIYAGNKKERKEAKGKYRYRVGYHNFGPASNISFEDCARCMMSMLESEGDEWVHKAPIIQY